MRILLAWGADVNARGEAGYTPLHEAASHGHSDVVDVLIAAGASKSSATEEGETPATFAQMCGYPELGSRLLPP